MHGGKEQKTAPSGLRTVFNVCDTHTPIHIHTHESLARLNIRVQNEFDIGVSRVILCTCTREQESPTQKKRESEEKKNKRHGVRERRNGIKCQTRNMLDRAQYKYYTYHTHPYMHTERRHSTHRVLVRTIVCMFLDKVRRHTDKLAAKWRKYFMLTERENEPQKSEESEKKPNAMRN